MTQSSPFEPSDGELDQNLQPIDQELCLLCSLDDDPLTEPGLPQSVVSTHTTLSLTGPWSYTMLILACGHVVNSEVTVKESVSFPSAG